MIRTLVSVCLLLLAGAAESNLTAAERSGAAAGKSASSSKTREKAAAPKKKPAIPEAKPAPAKKKTPEKAKASEKKPGAKEAAPGKKAAAPDSPSPPGDTKAVPARPSPRTVTLRPDQLAGFDKLPAPVRPLLTSALELAGRGLSYLPGSCDPEAGGTDCSGFIYHILRQAGWTDVPRQSNDMYRWLWRAGAFKAFNGVSLDSFELEDLRPGDLLFWVGTTRTGAGGRDPPVSHVMIYLGKRASDGEPVVVGASDGRTYEGQRMSGISVFDFRLPAPDSAARFIGYGHLPGLPLKRTQQ